MTILTASLQSLLKRNVRRMRNHILALIERRCDAARQHCCQAFASEQECV